MPIDPLPPSPAVKNNDGYGIGAIALHWLMFLMVVAVGILGLLHDSWPKRTQSFWIDLHAVIGLILWLLLAVRFWWRMRHPPPALPAEVSAVSRRLSQIVHWLLYALLFVTPILGVVTFIWHGRTFDFGFFQLNFHVAKDRTIFKPTEDIHGYLAYGIFAVVLVHALAALWHQFVKHDGILRRMWPSAASRRSLAVPVSGTDG
jgi:cytochrome b561